MSFELALPTIMKTVSFKKLSNMKAIYLLDKKIEKLKLEDCQEGEIDFDDYKYLKSLKIKNSHLKSFPKLPSSLDILTLDDCNLREIGYLPYSLTILNLRNDYYVDYSVISFLDNLESLTLYNLGMKTVTFKIPKKLKILDLGCNDLTEIPDWSENESLIDLNLDFNRIEIVKVPKNLLYLNLCHNENLKEIVFNDKLKLLNLIDSPQVFDIPTTVETLYLS